MGSVVFTYMHFWFPTIHNSIYFCTGLITFPSDIPALSYHNTLWYTILKLLTHTILLIFPPLFFKLPSILSYKVVYFTQSGSIPTVSNLSGNGGFKYCYHNCQTWRLGLNVRMRIGWTTTEGLCHVIGAFLQIRVGMWICLYVYMCMWEITGEEKGKLHIYLYSISSIFLVLCNEIWAVVSDKGND